MTLVVRREDGGLRRYCHLGTGNYHPRTARALHRLRPVHLRRGDRRRTCTRSSCSSPASTRTPQLQAPAAVAVHAARGAARDDRARDARTRAPGKPARIIAKMNALLEPQIIEALYAASQRRRADRSDRARRVRAAARRARASPRTSACARSSAASSSTRASSTSRTTATPELYLCERRLDGAQLLPPHRGRLPDRATTLQRARILRRPRDSTWPTTRRPGSCSPTAATRACERGDGSAATRRRSCSRATLPAPPPTSSRELAAARA